VDFLSFHLVQKSPVTSLNCIIINLSLGYYLYVTELSKAATLMGRKSAEARAQKWGKKEFVRRMREWGRLGGRPKGSEKKKGGAK